MMRHIPAKFSTSVEPRVHRVSTLNAIVKEWSPELRFLILASDDSDKQAADRLRASGLDNVGWIESSDLIAVGDIVKPNASNGKCVVLFRENDIHHSLLLTNQCNSYCLMCSQPPTNHEDSWLITEALDVIRHIRTSPASIGLSGGEPLLLPVGLRRVIDDISMRHPDTRIDVLTNGRLLAEPSIIESVLYGLKANVCWLVPLYGHADFVHEYVVQAQGAFDQTLNGLLTLQAHSQPVQLRIVLIDPVLRILPELCGFIGRNLPFVREVALMAAEPIGFALANREQCEVDLLNWRAELEESSRILNRHRVPFIFMNAPLCALPRLLWPHAKKSISDWKNVYSGECEKCSVKPLCSGLFAWHERGWKPTKIVAIEEEAM